MCAFDTLFLATAGSVFPEMADTAAALPAFSSATSGVAHCVVQFSIGAAAGPAADSVHRRQYEAAVLARTALLALPDIDPALAARLSKCGAGGDGGSDAAAAAAAPQERLFDAIAELAASSTPSQVRDICSAAVGVAAGSLALQAAHFDRDARNRRNDLSGRLVLSAPDARGFITVSLVPMNANGRPLQPLVVLAMATIRVPPAYFLFGTGAGVYAVGYIMLNGVLTAVGLMHEIGGLDPGAVRSALVVCGTLGSLSSPIRSRPRWCGSPASAPPRPRRPWPRPPPPRCPCSRPCTRSWSATPWWCWARAGAGATRARAPVWQCSERPGVWRAPRPPVRPPVWRTKSSRARTPRAALPADGGTRT